MKRMTGSSSDKVKPLSVGEKLARSAMRKRANTFVDARDEMYVTQACSYRAYTDTTFRYREGKLGRLSRRLASVPLSNLPQPALLISSHHLCSPSSFLVHETDVWKDKFSQFEALTERLSDEACVLSSLPRLFVARLITPRPDL